MIVANASSGCECGAYTKVLTRTVHARDVRAAISYRQVKAKFHYAGWFEAGSNQLV